MLYALLLGLAPAPPAQAAVDAWADAYSHQKGEAPTPMSVKGVAVERTIAEFMEVCVRPDWEVAQIQNAVQTSDFGYTAQHLNDSPNSFGWQSKNDFLVVNVDPMFSQCALSIGSNQPRTGQQLLAMLRPAVEAELGRQVQENDHAFFLQWSDPDSGDVERITLANGSNKPQQAIWYVFDKTAPGVREKLDAMHTPQGSSSK